MSNKRLPLHPGEFIKRVYIEEGGLTQSALADALDVNKGTLSRLIRGETDLTPTMAWKLHCVLGRSAQSWMNMQQRYSLAVTEAANRKWKPKCILKDGKLEAA